MDKLKITSISTRWRLLMMVVVIIGVLLYVKAVFFAEPVEVAWKKRAQIALNRLGDRNLDECDKGLEHAFEHPKEVAMGPLQTYGLIVNVAGEAMTSSYTYDNEELSSFQISSLPKGWIVMQKANSKTLSIIVSSSHCVFDLYTDNPLHISANILDNVFHA